MALIIPTINRARFNFEINIEGRVYRFNFQYNSVGAFYSFSINTRANVPIITGIKVVLGYELIRRYGREDLPPGAIVPIDTTKKHTRVDITNLGNDVKLVYLTQQEVGNVLS